MDITEVSEFEKGRVRGRLVAAYSEGYIKGLHEYEKEKNKNE